MKTAMAMTMTVTKIMTIIVTTTMTKVMMTMIMTRPSQLNNLIHGTAKTKLCTHKHKSKTYYGHDNV